MSETSPTPARRWLALLVAGLAVLLLVGSALAGLGARWSWWHYRTGFLLLRWTVYGAIALGLASLVAVLLTRPGGRQRGLPFAVFALLVSLTLLANTVAWRARARGAAPIHDITTDMRDPPEFVAVAVQRADAPNGVAYGGPEVAARQRAAYPDILPLVLDVSGAGAFEAALDAARGMGWEIVAADASTGHIEATDRTFWFGFRDDVVIRLTPAGERTLVDVRSASRVGRSDVGTNARRIRAYLERLGGPGG